jgi:hypothetical protein
MYRFIVFFFLLEMIYTRSLYGFLLKPNWAQDELGGRFI